MNTKRRAWWISEVSGGPGLLDRMREEIEKEGPFAEEAKEVLKKLQSDQN